MKIIAFIAFSIIGISAAAQEFAFELWHEGKLILDSGDTLRGSIKYDLQSDLIQYQFNKALQGILLIALFISWSIQSTCFF
jgi:hypothetical protein